MVKRDRVRIVNTTPALLDKICAKPFRPNDERECRAASGRPVAVAIREGFKRAPYCKTVLLNGEPVGVFGVTAPSLISQTGVPWMLGLPALTENAECRKTIRKRSVEFRNAMFKLFPKLENYEDVRNTVSMKWLKWLGFRMDEPKPYGVAGLSFVRFWLERSA